MRGDLFDIFQAFGNKEKFNYKFLDLRFKNCVCLEGKLSLKKTFSTINETEVMIPSTPHTQENKKIGLVYVNRRGFGLLFFTKFLLKISLFEWIKNLLV